MSPDKNIEDFTIIYTKYWKELYLFVQNRVKDPSVVEDFLHDIFLGLLKSTRIESYSHSDIRAYLYKSLRNRIIDYYRKNQQDKTLDDDLSFWDTYENPNMDKIVKNEFNMFFEQEVTRLPNQMKKIAVLSFKEGLDHDEIAQKLILSKKTVKNQLAMANKKIKSAWLKVIE